MKQRLTALQADIVASLTAIGGGGTLGEIYDVVCRTQHGRGLSLPVLRQALHVLEEKHDLVMQVTDMFFLRAAIRDTDPQAARQGTTETRTDMARDMVHGIASLIEAASDLSCAVLADPSSITVEQIEKVANYHSVVENLAGEIMSLNRSLGILGTLERGEIDRQEVIAPHSTEAREIVAGESPA